MSSLRTSRSNSQCLASIPKKIAPITTALPRAAQIAGHLTKEHITPTTARIAKNSFTSSITKTYSSSDISTNKTRNMASQYSIRKVGQPNTIDYRIYIEHDGKPISPFHDIPLYANPEGTILNMIVEIPRWTNAKLEVSLTFWQDTNLLALLDLIARVELMIQLLTFYYRLAKNYS